MCLFLCWYHAGFHSVLLLPCLLFSLLYSPFFLLLFFFWDEVSISILAQPLRAKIIIFYFLHYYVQLICDICVYIYVYIHTMYTDVLLHIYTHNVHICIYFGSYYEEYLILSGRWRELSLYSEILLTFLCWVSYLAT